MFCLILKAFHNLIMSSCGIYRLKAKGNMSRPLSLYMLHVYYCSVISSIALLYCFQTPNSILLLLVNKILMLYCPPPPPPPTHTHIAPKHFAISALNCQVSENIGAGVWLLTNFVYFSSPLISTPSLSLCISVCLCVFSSLSLFVYLHVCLSVCLSLCLCLSFPLYLSISLSIYMYPTLLISTYFSLCL